MLLGSKPQQEIRSLWDSGVITWSEYESHVFRHATPLTFSCWVSSLPDEIGESFVSRVHALSRTNPEDLFAVQGGAYNLPQEGDTPEEKEALVEKAKLLVDSIQP